MRTTEKATLHFDLRHLSHLPGDQQFTLHGLESSTPITAHTDQTRLEHAGLNKALQMMPQEHLDSFTHFVEGIDLPADATSFLWVGYPSKNPEAVVDDIAVVFQQVPTADVRRAARAMALESGPVNPSVLAHYGVTQTTSDQDHEETHVQASFLVNYKKTALTIVMQHPDIGTLVPSLHYRIAEKIIAQQPSFTQLWQYLSEHPAESDEPWYENTYVRDPNGNVMEPVSGLKDKQGNPIIWPTKQIDGQQVSVIPQQKLSDGLTDAARPLVQDAAKIIKQTPWLKGQHWTTQHGVTEHTRTNVPGNSSLEAATPTGVDPIREAIMTDELALDATGTASPDWTLVSKTSQYGLNLYDDTLNYDPVSKTLSFKVKNWANRGLGVYVQFLDPNNQPIDNPEGWKDQLGSIASPIRSWIEPSTNKRYLTHIQPGNVIFGGPVWTDRTEISFVVPDEASGVNILVGGLGNGHWDMDVDKPGLIYTCAVCYGIPSLLSILSVGVQSSKWYTDFFKDPENVYILIAVAFLPFGALLGAGTQTVGVDVTLTKAADFVGGMIFSAGLQALATQVGGYVSSEEMIQSTPFAGWALKIASCAAAIASMIATSVEVGKSPATYTLEAKRSMRLEVIVNPDPTHGTSTQKPIWPKVSDHYVITVQFQGGTTLRKAGPMPGAEDAPIDVTFSKLTNDALPSAPGQKFQIIAVIYSANNWIAGKWISGWIDAAPTDGDKRTETGSIIEQLVPLTPTTQYNHKVKLNYDGTTSAYIWENTLFSISDSLTPSFVAGPVAQSVIDAFWSNRVRLSTNSTITSVGLADQWQIVDSTINTTYAVNRVPIRDDSGEVVGHELEVSNMTHPAPAETTTSLASQDVSALVGITINNLAYKLGYCYLADNQNLPLDSGTTAQSTAMYVFQSISTLASPQAGMKSPTLGMSLKPYIAYDQFGPAGLFQLEPATDYMDELNDGGDVPDGISRVFSDKGFTLPAGAQITTLTASASWQIGNGSQTLYDLRRQVDVIKVFRAPVPEFSPNNFYLDSRTYEDNKVYHLRLVNLHDDSGPSFDYGSQASDAKTSWGAFEMPNLDAIVVHPNGYVAAISYEDDKLAILELPQEAKSDADAPRALPFSGTGSPEGLMRGPVGMTITSDGRILILERDNGRIQAFDTQANPVQCFAAELVFTLDTSFVADLDSDTASTALIKALQGKIPVKNTAAGAADSRYLLTPLFSLPQSFVAVLNTQTVTDSLRDQFSQHAVELGQDVVITTTDTNMWLVEDRSNNLTHDLRFNGEGLNEVDVYRGMTPTITVKSPGAEWIVRDRTNTLTFEVRKQPVSQGSTQMVLQFQRLSSLMSLKDGPSDSIAYLDVAVENKGFIYVLSYQKPGDTATDYRLDIYNPDGTPVTADTTIHNGQVNGARITVDQWRTLFTLNYQQMEGAGGRPEPTISQWIPSTPDPA